MDHNDWPIVGMAHNDYDSCRIVAKGVHPLRLTSVTLQSQTVNGGRCTVKVNLIILPTRWDMGGNRAQ